MGGMAAQIPIKADPDRNREALCKVAADKEREARDGHDGTWVAHPGLIETARTAFDAEMTGPNNLDRLREDVQVNADDLLAVPTGEITEAGLRQNLNVGVLYLEAWLRGVGCVPLYDLMEDAATAEISRTQIWQWLHHGATLNDGRQVTEEFVRSLLAEELASIRQNIGNELYASGKYELSARLFEGLIVQEELEEFLTLPAYAHL
jgi:malate synthase